MQKRSKSQDNWTFVAGLGALALGIYYFFVYSKKYKRYIKPLNLGGIPTTDQEELQKAVMKLKVTEQDGHISAEILKKISQLLEDFLKPFLQQEAYSSRQSRRNYMDDFKSYIEVLRIHHDMARQVFGSTCVYIGEWLSIDGRRIIEDSFFHYQTHNDHFRFLHPTFPHNIEVGLPFKSKIDKVMFIQVETDMLQIVQEEGELLKNNVTLLKDMTIVAVLLARVLDRVYIQYGYENEDLFSLFAGILPALIGYDKQCTELFINFNTKLIQTANEVLEVYNAGVKPT